MVDHSHKQQEVLKDEKRFAISEYLRGCEKPQSLGEIARGIDHRDEAIVLRHLAILVDAELVEKVPGTRKYRLVGGK